MGPGELLGHIHGGRVLDVATGAGGFVHYLLAGLADYDEIVGIDTNGAQAETFREAFAERRHIRFEVRDAYATGFQAEEFDTVAVSNSLHHFARPKAVLREMLRVLRPGGWLILFEMYRDHQGEPQLTHVRLHHWWAAIDRVHGITHRKTFKRESLVSLVQPLGLENLVLADVVNADDDPLDPEAREELSPVIDRYIQRASGVPALIAEGERLRRRLTRIGILGATSLAAVGQKRPPETSPIPRA